ncbi:MAG: polyphosphate kinase 2 family protein [Xanthomonadales bacterium]|nr:polyphosphate kinase 2 family protein [Xanthomonadales bacterium]
MSGGLLRRVQSDSRWRVPEDGTMGADELRHLSPVPESPDHDDRERLLGARKKLRRLQQALYADQRFALLVIFQALDAAGKDGTIRRVFSRMDPAGVRVSSFKAPSELETAHDFLWRTSLQLPRRGHIGVFNRSYYEEVLVVRVHPEYLGAQYPGGLPDLDALWQERYRAIREHERHLAAANTVVVKFWLHVSPEEQQRRFLSRAREPDKQWKFNPNDIRDAGHREAFDRAALDMLNATSAPWAPWFAIPADNKPRMRALVAETLLDVMRGLDLGYPQPGAKTRAFMEEWAARIAGDQD